MLKSELGLIENGYLFGETVESFGEFGVSKGDLLNGRLEMSWNNGSSRINY
jgi:hypothetical protein